MRQRHGGDLTHVQGSHDAPSRRNCRLRKEWLLKMEGGEWPPQEQQQESQLQKQPWELPLQKEQMAHADQKPILVATSPKYQGLQCQSLQRQG